MANDIEKIILKMQGGQGKAREEANRKIEEQTNILKKLEETIKSQGGNIERNAEYQKANAKIEKEKFNLEKKTSGNRAKLQETKREDKKSKDKDTALLKKMAGSLGGLLKLGKVTKVVKTGLFAGLSALAIGGTMLALSKFLDSKTWTSLTEKIGELAQFVANFFTSESWEKIKTRFKELTAKLKEFLFSIDYVGIINKLISFACNIRDNWKLISIALAALALGLSLGPLGIGILAFYTIKGGWKIFKSIKNGFKLLYNALADLSRSLFSTVDDVNKPKAVTELDKFKTLNDPKGDPSSRTTAIIEERKARRLRLEKLKELFVRRARSDGVSDILAKRAAFAELNDPKGDSSKKVKTIIRRANMGVDGKPIRTDGGIGELVKAQTRKAVFDDLNDPQGDGSKRVKMITDGPGGMGKGSLVDKIIRRANMGGGKVRVGDISGGVDELVTKKALADKIKFNKDLNRFIAADKISMENFKVYQKGQIVSKDLVRKAGLITDVPPISSTESIKARRLKFGVKSGFAVDALLGGVLANFNPEMVSASQRSVVPMLDRSLTGAAIGVTGDVIDFITAAARYTKNAFDPKGTSENFMTAESSFFGDVTSGVPILKALKKEFTSPNTFVAKNQFVGEKMRDAYVAGAGQNLISNLDEKGNFQGESFGPILGKGMHDTGGAIISAVASVLIGGRDAAKAILNSGGSTLKLNDTEKRALFMERMIEDGKAPMFSRSYSEGVGEQKGLFSFFGFGKKKSQEIADLIIRTSSGNTQEVLSAEILRTIKNQDGLNAAAPVVINNSSSNHTTNQVSINHPDQVYSVGP